MPVAQLDEYKVLRITTLGKDRDAEARDLLDRVAKQVQPIMRKRQWTVHKLSEFIPRSPNLLGLNINRGREVKIRLRSAGREHSFYDWNHILGTMLHELCHNRIGPHNAEFYKLLDELWTEAEELMDKGITGTCQGFDAPSAGRLGSHAFIPTHNPPEHKMADAVRRAAEARAQKLSIMPAGPCKLGGSISYKSMSPAQAAAAAAERRARDNLWCGAEHTAEQVQREVGSGTGAASNTSSRSASPAPAGAAVAAHVPSAVGEQQLTSSGAAAAGAPAAKSQAKQGIAEVSAGAAKAAATVAAAQAAMQRLQPQQQALQQLHLAAFLQQQQQQQQQAAVLQEQSQQHVQRQRQQRQQHQNRKRAAEVDAIDLTLSDDEIEHYTNTRAEGFGGAGLGCPCCSGLVTILDDDAAVAAEAAGAVSWRAWCARHRQQRQQQLDQRQALQQQQQQQLDRRREGSAWVCTVCTLVNKPLVLQCEACLSLRSTQ